MSSDAHTAIKDSVPPLVERPCQQLVGSPESLLGSCQESPGTHGCAPSVPADGGGEEVGRGRHTVREHCAVLKGLLTAQAHVF